MAITRKIEVGIALGHQYVSENVIKNFGDFGAIFWKNPWAIVNGEEDDPFRIPNLDTVLYFQYSDAIDEFKKALSDQAVNVCCSCERLLRKKSVTEAKNIDSNVWNNLLDYISYSTGILAKFRQ